MTNRTSRRRHWPFFAALLLTVGSLLSPALAQDKPDAPLTDEKVVSAMKRAADSLLKAMNHDNWESPHDWPGPNGERGGVTALVLYSLLHAGQSLQDEPEYQSKLSWRSAELAPAVAWLSQLEPTETYVAGLQASALTLVPRRQDEKTGEGPLAALERDKSYILGAMGLYGGYDYGYPGMTRDTGTFSSAWEDYFQAKITGNQPAIDTARLALVSQINRMRQTFGGAEGAFTRLVLELRMKKKSADLQESARLDREIREVQIFISRDMPPPLQDFAANYRDAKQRMDELLDAQRRGDMTNITMWDGTLKKNVPAAKADLPKLLEQAKTSLDNADYQLKNRFSPIGDLSNSQYGTLGAWALADYGVELPDNYWEIQDRFWRILQRSDGSWPYETSRSTALDPHPAMSVAGIASLFIAQEFVDVQLRSTPKVDKQLDAGLAWLNKNFRPGSQNYYYMYGVERVGLASGLKFFGTIDWYKTQADAIVKSQADNGSFPGDYDPPISTAYALLFLARGRNPVVFNKLQYPGPWNARPRDDAYVTRWLSTKRFERPINWQVVNLQVSPQEWQDAPILLITGSGDPRFTKNDLAKLRNFVNAGGMIFSSADDGSSAFTAAVKKYAAEICDKRYEMRPLPRNHPMFSTDLGVDLVNPPPLLAASNGIREIWIHSPQDAGADWQLRKFTSKNFELAAALYLYASGMAGLRAKLQPLTVTTPADPPARTIGVAKIVYAGNCDPEPGAWPRMAQLARANFKTQVNLASVKFADLDPKKQKLASLTGTTTVSFSDQDAAALKAYLDAGGILFVDAAGGNPEFAASARKLIALACGENALQPLAPDHPIYTGALPDGLKIGEVDFRKFGRITLHRPIMAPELYAVTTADHASVLFSPWDICSGFLGTKTWGIVGFAPKTSEALARNMLLYALNPTAP